MARDRIKTHPRIRKKGTEPKTRGLGRGWHGDSAGHAAAARKAVSRGKKTQRQFIKEVYREGRSLLLSKKKSAMKASKLLVTARREAGFKSRKSIAWHQERSMRRRGK